MPPSGLPVARMACGDSAVTIRIASGNAFCNASKTGLSDRIVRRRRHQRLITPYTAGLFRHDRPYPCGNRAAILRGRAEVAEW